jgi:DNA-binding response OmpR family regulator
VSAKILVVDDDIVLVKTVTHLLAAAGYKALPATTTKDALHLLSTQRPDLALLDVMVPEIGGWELCRQIRTFSDLPIIFLTASGDVDSVVKGLELGADDYLVKPIIPAEFMARIKARLRRHITPEIFVTANGELVINLNERHVTLYGAEVELTPREFDLLATFASQPDRVISAPDLVSRAWGMTDDNAAENIKAYIHYLRKKLEDDPAAPRWIQTVRGVGYRLTSG